MITNRQELYEYLNADAALYSKVSSGFINRIKNRLVTSPQSTQWKIYSYIKSMRYAEFHLNNSILMKRISIKSLLHTVCLLYRYWRLRKLSYATGFQIDPNSVGKGLRIFHYGSIIINSKAKIGDYATLYPGVVIGSKPNGYPLIGDHCFIGAGSKILGGGKNWK